MIERRALIRHKSFIKGRIHFNNRLSSMDCIVRDLTEKGARLQVSESIALPDTFELYLPNKDAHFRARAQWRKGDQLGVSWTPESA
jgi:PilZ domain-containing protein